MTLDFNVSCIFKMFGKMSTEGDKHYFYLLNLYDDPLLVQVQIKAELKNNLTQSNTFLFNSLLYCFLSDPRAEFIASV